MNCSILWRRLCRRVAVEARIFRYVLRENTQKCGRIFLPVKIRTRVSRLLWNLCPFLSRKWYTTDMDSMNGNVNPPSPLLKPAGDVRYLARQPILNRKGSVHGYALLFDTAADGIIDGRSRDAARAILDDAVLIGMDRLAGGLPFFLRCTSEALLEQLVTVLPTSTTILGVPESLRVSPKLLDACVQLRDAGFRIALMDYTAPMEEHPLLEMADYVKVVLPQLDEAARLRLRARRKDSQAVFVAEGVDSQEDYRAAVEEDFQYFQGLYFCFPEMIRSATIPANRTSHLEILRLLQQDPLDLKKVSQDVQRDAALVLRLLRLVNSPICAIRQDVDSVETAIIILGEKTFRRIANLAILRELNGDQSSEILHTALVRARFCELASGLAGLDSSEQYLLGLLSLLPAMMRCPMDTLAPELPLRLEICNALLGAQAQERSLLGWIELHERNQCNLEIAHSKQWNLNEQKLNQFYVDALMWEAAMPRTL